MFYLQTLLLQHTDMMCNIRVTSLNYFHAPIAPMSDNANQVKSSSISSSSSSGILLFRTAGQ